MRGRIKTGVRRMVCWLIGNCVLFLGFYDRKFISGRHFHGDISGRFAVGWEWVVMDWFSCRRLRRNLDIPWPVSPLISVVNWHNIIFDPDDLNNFQGVGNYYQADGIIEIGKGTYIAQNVGIITANHDLNDPSSREAPRPVHIGEKCWIGMNAVILPGVTLGPHVVVGAGAVVTRSFPEGYCVVVGNPARLVRRIDAESDDKRQAEEYQA